MTAVNRTESGHVFACLPDVPCSFCHPATPGYMGGFVGDCLGCRRTHREYVAGHRNTHDGHEHKLIGPEDPFPENGVPCRCGCSPACSVNGAMRTTVLREVRAILDRERNAHPFGLSTPSAVAGNRELAERAEQAEAAIARVEALCDKADAEAFDFDYIEGMGGLTTDEVRAALDGEA